MRCDVAVGARSITGAAGEDFVSKDERAGRETAGRLRLPTDLAGSGIETNQVIVRRGEDDDVFKDTEGLRPCRATVGTLVFPDQVTVRRIESLHSRLRHAALL